MSRRRSRRERFRTRRVLFAAVFLGAALVGYTFVRITIQDHAIAREIAATRAEIAALGLQQGSLRAQIGLRQTDEYLEQKARELGYVRPGEGLVTTGSPASAPQSAREPGSTRLGRWLALFFSR